MLRTGSAGEGFDTAVYFAVILKSYFSRHIQIARHPLIASRLACLNPTTMAHPTCPMPRWSVDNNGSTLT